MHTNAQTRQTALAVIGFWTLHPEKHDQSTFVSDLHDIKETQSLCGTTLCAAGTTVYIEGGIQGLLKMQHADDYTETARHLLGITYEESHALFYDMDNERARRVVAAIADGDTRVFNREYADWEF